MQGLSVVCEMQGLSVVGTVSIWGRVIEHVAGYRAEFAYPQRVHLVCAVRGCRGRSVTPRRVVRMGAEILAVCSNHDDSAGPVASTAADVQQQLLDEYRIDLLSLETFDDLDLTSAPRVCAP